MAKTRQNKFTGSPKLHSERETTLDKSYNSRKGRKPFTKKTSHTTHGERENPSGKKKKLEREKTLNKKKRQLTGDNSIKNKKRHWKQGDNLGLKTINRRQPIKKQET